MDNVQSAHLERLTEDRNRVASAYRECREGNPWQAAKLERRYDLLTEQIDCLHTAIHKSERQRL